MRVLITGAAGFIGSHLVDRCVAEGWSVAGVDDLSNGHVEFVGKACNLHVADFASDEVLALVKARSFDVVMHLAATPRVSYSVEHPLETHENNVTKSLALIDSCRGNVARFVFASSSSVYGGADVLPTPEATRKWPKSPYALQKSAIEDYLQLYRELYGLDSASLRLFNVFGPRQLGGSPYATAVAAWLTAIKAGQPMRSDGTGEQSRDMCYVDNVTRAFVLAAQSSYEETAPFMRFNVACGDRVTNNDILRDLQRRYPGTAVVHAPFRAGDVMHTQASIVLAQTLLGYEPEVSFWEGLDRTVAWYDAEWSNVSKMRAGV